MTYVKNCVWCHRRWRGGSLEKIQPRLKDLFNIRRDMEFNGEKRHGVVNRTTVVRLSKNQRRGPAKIRGTDETFTTHGWQRLFPYSRLPWTNVYSVFSLEPFLFPCPSSREGSKRRLRELNGLTYRRRVCAWHLGFFH